MLLRRACGGPAAETVGSGSRDYDAGARLM
jgi:hypothetical protein